MNEKSVKEFVKEMEKMIWWIFIIALVFVMTVGAICGLIVAKRTDEHFEKNYKKMLDSHKE